MNWKQLYNSSTAEERLEATIQMIRTIEARQKRRVFVRGRFMPDRRRQAVHFIGDRRRQGSVAPRLVMLGTFLFILATLSVAMWTISVYAPPNIGAPVLALNVIMLGSIVLARPTRRLRPAIE